MYIGVYSKVGLKDYEITVCFGQSAENKIYKLIAQLSRKKPQESEEEISSDEEFWNPQMERMTVFRREIEVKVRKLIKFKQDRVRFMKLVEFI